MIPPCLVAMAFVVDSECVLRYDNERGKDDHKHLEYEELPYTFISPQAMEKLAVG